MNVAPIPRNEASFDKANYFALGVAIGAINLVAFTALYQRHTSCTQFPEIVYSFSSQLISVMRQIPADSVETSMLMRAPLVEELFFRKFLQTVLLKDLPNSIGHRLDSQKAKVIRVIAVALIFSLSHALPPSVGLPYCSNSRIYSALLLGLVAGSIQERTNRITFPILFHIGWNVPVVLLDIAYRLEA